MSALFCKTSNFYLNTKFNVCKFKYSKFKRDLQLSKDSIIDFLKILYNQVHRPKKTKQIDKNVF